ncbi:MAG: hypothetical protein P4M15_06720 [Alphaproteobacteria bacterium]|nr:hypothetical protein [Alphaproteobacteria bacterium]
MLVKERTNQLDDNAPTLLITGWQVVGHNKGEIYSEIYQQQIEEPKCCFVRLMIYEMPGREGIDIGYLAVNGKKLKATSSNVAWAMRYARVLGRMIESDENFSPQRAWQEAGMAPEGCPSPMDMESAVIPKRNPLKDFCRGLRRADT